MGAEIVLASREPDRGALWLVGLASAIVGFLGLGNLVYYFLARKRLPEDDAAKS